MTKDNDDMDRPVWGIKGIAEVANRTPRQAYHLIVNGKLPAKQVGNRWVSTKRKILGEITGESAA